MTRVQDSIQSPVQVYLEVPWFEFHILKNCLLRMTEALSFAIWFPLLVPFLSSLIVRVIVQDVQSFESTKLYPFQILIEIEEHFFRLTLIVPQTDTFIVYTLQFELKIRIFLVKVIPSNPSPDFLFPSSTRRAVLWVSVL